MGLNSKQVAAIAEKMKQDSKPVDMPKAEKGKPTSDFKTPPRSLKPQALKIPKGSAAQKPKFKISSISDLKKARQMIKGDY